jgi:hypothetical protein
MLSLYQNKNGIESDEEQDIHDGKPPEDPNSQDSQVSSEIKNLLKRIKY